MASRGGGYPVLFTMLDELTYLFSLENIKPLFVLVYLAMTRPILLGQKDFEKCGETVPLKLIIHAD
jgi:hypothetical protein